MALSSNAIEVTELLQQAEQFLRNYNKDDVGNEAAIEDILQQLGRINTLHLSHVQAQQFTRIESEIHNIRLNLQLEEDAGSDAQDSLSVQASAHPPPSSPRIHDEPSATDNDDIRATLSAILSRLERLEAQQRPYSANGATTLVL